MVLAFMKLNVHLRKQEEKETLFKIEKTVFLNLNYWSKCKIILSMLKIGKYL